MLLANNRMKKKRKFFGAFDYVRSFLRMRDSKTVCIFNYLRTNFMESLDVTDIEILRLLQRDASLTHKEIAFKLHKSVATVHERARRLKERGYIKKVVAVLDGKRLGVGLIAFSHVLLNEHTKETLDKFEHAVSKFPE